MNAEVRAALDAWLEQRKKRVLQRNESALFFTKQGTRLATRSIGDVVRRLGQEANLTPSAHILETIPFQGQPQLAVSVLEGG